MRNMKNRGQGRNFRPKSQQDEKAFQPEKKKLNLVKKGDEEIRLNKYIANSGVCSRREADKLIADGEITVNGQVVTELGAKVCKRDEVLYKGKPLMVEKKVYLLLNKPRGFVTTLDDPHAEHTVMELVDSACDERIYPVGRLDKETSGVLLFTNDGELAKKLTHPSYEKKKIYHVFLNVDFDEAHLSQIQQGFELEDGFIKADSISFVDSADKKQVGIEIHSGRNRIVRRIFAHFGYKVARLDRVYFAGLTKKNLPRGNWRFLTPKEINFFKMS
ncbi:pseudouridine synthase [Mangrovibacterium marinum]|uniref:Pseudouridine synthase n=1 Tax=Mangrovibacterium marinum TaxID=1639118 RepID=A0A2T5C173_9BACT|nr:pseudouridine synthase [Mangrovibacterium marinum]PTN08364.1 pseudouridine synthase [Mangrovibacterium marinum]